jgi:hypothetical protein
MFSLHTLITLALIGIGALYIWRSGEFKGRARQLARAHCKQLELQLLDDSMVIVGLWPVRDARGRLALRRRYQFEFASTGDRRYVGWLALEGLQLQQIELETYKLPSQE